MDVDVDVDVGGLDCHEKAARAFLLSLPCVDSLRYSPLRKLHAILMVGLREGRESYAVSWLTLLGLELVLAPILPG